VTGLPRLDSVAQIVDCEHKTAPESKYGIPFAYSIGTPALRGANVDFKQAKPINEETYLVWTRRAVPVAGDLIFAREAPVGGVGFVKGDRRICLGQRTVLIRTDSKHLDPKFLFYALKSPLVQRWIQDRSTGSTVEHLNVADVRSLPLPFYPPLPEQKRIAAVLGALDDLIESNSQLVTNLEELVVKVGEEFLQQCKNFEKVPLLDLVEITKGYSYKSSELISGGGWLVNLKNVGRGGAFQPGGFKPLNGLPKEKHFVENGDILVALTDITQDHAVVGRPIRVRRGALEGNLVASLDLVILRPRLHMSREWLFSILSSREFHSHALAHCNGTTVVHMASSAIPTFQAPKLDSSKIAGLTREIATLWAAADDISLEIDELILVRDELLPLLMSAKITVKDACS
jgi:type I restriction enzyme S subunit